MERNYETRHIFLAIGVCILISAPFIIYIAPKTVANIMYHTADTWHVFAPRENVTAYGIGVLFLFLACMSLFLFNVRKRSIVLSIVLVLASVVPFSLGAQSYKAFTPEAVSFKPLLSRTAYTYTWEEIESMTYLKDETGYTFALEFLFVDGNKMNLERDAYYHGIQVQLLHKLRQMKIPVISP